MIYLIHSLQTLSEWALSSFFNDQIDANIIFAILIQVSPTYVKIIQNHQKITPDYVEC